MWYCYLLKSFTVADINNLTIITSLSHYCLKFAHCCFHYLKGCAKIVFSHVAIDYQCFCCKKLLTFCSLCLSFCFVPGSRPGTQDAIDLLFIFLPFVPESDFPDPEMDSIYCFIFGYKKMWWQKYIPIATGMSFNYLVFPQLPVCFRLLPIFLRLISWSWNLVYLPGW